jgi:hypothetical protein
MLPLPSNATATGLYSPPPPPPPLPLPPGQYCCHCHHCSQGCHRPWPKKEATAAPPPENQQQHQCENVYKSRKLGHIILPTVLREFSN